jgi:hypothetical protein
LSSEELEFQIKDLVKKVANDEFHAENLKINIDKMMTAKEFNQLKEEIKGYAEYYKISSRNYKSNRELYLFYKFYFKNNQQMVITVIHRYETSFMFIRFIRVRSINKGE